jgi:hypothetical protein
MVLNEYWGIPSDESDDSDVEMEEAPEVQPAKLLDVDKAIDFMRFVFKEGLAFLDNGSGRCLADRMFVDLGGFMVDKILEQPQREGPCRMRMLKPSFEYDLAHAFAKEDGRVLPRNSRGISLGYLLICVPHLILINTTWFCLRAMSTARERLWRGFLGLCRILISLTLLHILKQQSFRCSLKLG